MKKQDINKSLKCNLNGTNQEMHKKFTPKVSASW